MIKIVAKASVLSTKKAEYLALAKELIAASRAEAGCISYELYEDRHNPNVLTFIEEWEDEAAIESHNNSPHFLTILPKMGEYRLGPSEITQYVIANYSE